MQQPRRRRRRRRREAATGSMTAARRPAAVPPAVPLAVRRRVDVIGLFTTSPRVSVDHDHDQSCLPTTR